MERPPLAQRLPGTPRHACTGATPSPASAQLPPGKDDLAPGLADRQRRAAASSRMPEDTAHLIDTAPVTSVSAGTAGFPTSEALSFSSCASGGRPCAVADLAGRGTPKALLRSHLPRRPQYLQLLSEKLFGIASRTCDGWHRAGGTKRERGPKLPRAMRSVTRLRHPLRERDARPSTASWGRSCQRTGESYLQAGAVRIAEDDLIHRPRRTGQSHWASCASRPRHPGGRGGGRCRQLCALPLGRTAARILARLPVLVIAWECDLMPARLPVVIA